VRKGATRKSRHGGPILSGALLCAAFVGVSLVLAWPAIHGDFLSDDYLYIVGNPYVHQLSLENAKELLDPWGTAASQTLNYAPVHLFVHALEWHFFGEENMLGWRVVNAVAHGLTSALLVLLLLRSTIPAKAAIAGGAFFLVHPANVEVLAWIFQLKTILSLALSLGALCLHPRRPALAALLFALALLAKITAVAVLPVLAVQAWSRSRDGREPARWGWVALWCAAFALVAVPEMDAFQRQADPRLMIHEDPLVHARTIVAFAMRYLVMATTSYGVSNFQEPPPAVSWADPWWLGGLAALSLLGWRTLVMLRRRDEEAAYWVMAAAAFSPVSQIFPFLFPIADRYLYPVLPGLIGGAILAGRAGLRRAQDRWGEPTQADLATFSRVGLIAVSVVLLVFAVRSHDRAPVFLNSLAMMKDAAVHYPEGVQAQILKGHAAARARDTERAVLAFQRAVDLGFADLGALLEHPELAVLRTQPAFREVIRGLALRDIERLSAQQTPTQVELRQLALAYVVRDRLADAISTLERALDVEGLRDEQIRDELEGLRRRQRALAPD
jgi:hypothetical protein